MPDIHEKRKLDSDDEQPVKRRVIGPSLPPEASAAGSDSDSDEDDFGPSLPPPPGQASSISQEQSQALESAAVPQQIENSRDDWMLHPPEQSDWASKIDPTQLRNRKFQTGKSARSSTSKQIDSSWVESPEERIRRLEDQVMGVGNAKDHINKVDSSSTKAAHIKAMEGMIKKFNNQKEKKNGQLEKPEKATKEEDDPSARAFDREKDMAISSKISNAQRRDMVNRASGYSSRFTKGDFL
ncbi:hypothetical protein N7495_001858 [Penicillium taxi]|uniref:uncharacterized protein n=1 Tax=Penicillium taxi TaxID=168475 RepID=UPI0025451320|nr:uncharacterized protein N7495_001858 [Penicillium taxi]KAJ5909176.1 hypothetical protein N7495_001858 [Penicillium taxi]